MNTENCLTNKPLSEEIRNAVSAVAPKDEKILFAIVGDLSIDGKYCETALLVSAERFYSYDLSFENHVLTYRHDEIEAPSSSVCTATPAFRCFRKTKSVPFVCSVIPMP